MIKAKTVYGAYHAMESLSQLIIFNTAEERYEIRGAEWLITDAPAYPVGRAFVFSLTSSIVDC